MRQVDTWQTGRAHDNFTAWARHLLLLRPAMPCPRSVLLTGLLSLLLGLAANVQTTADGTRAVVNVVLDPKASPAPVRDALTALGAEIFAQAGNVLGAWLPLGQTGAAARVPGVFSVSLVRRPHHWVGKATTQGVRVLDVAKVNAAGYEGTGITVGVLSDSFDTATQDAVGQPLTDHADDDIASGDLPGPGNPDGYTTPVTVLADGDATDTDEGRAMLQIVHDLAPAAALAFCANGATPAALAANIRALRASAGCDVIVDDAVFDEEPFFSDGPAAQAVDDVVHSDDLGGRKVLYYSADVLAGAVVKARVLQISAKTKATGTFVNKIGTGYSPVVGYGLIDAAAALAQLLGGS